MERTYLTHRFYVQDSSRLSDDQFVTLSTYHQQPLPVLPYLLSPACLHLVPNIQKHNSSYQRGRQTCYWVSNSFNFHLYKSQCQSQRIYWHKQIHVSSSRGGYNIFTIHLKSMVYCLQINKIKEPLRTQIMCLQCYEPRKKVWKGSVL